jgi:hypothetical protein
MKKSQALTIYLVLLVLILQSYPIFAQKTDIQVNGQRIFKTISYMASDKFLGRKPNTPEFYKLQDWVVKQYKSWGLESAGDSSTFYQSVPISREYAFSYGTPGLIINGRKFFSRYDDFRIDAKSSTGKKIKGKMVFAGYGISAPDKGLDEYAGVDVKGKIVLVLKGNPNDFEPPRGWMSRQDTTKEKTPEDWKQESADSTKIKTAYNKGAAAIILYNPEEEPTSYFRRSRTKLEVSPFQHNFIIVTNLSKDAFQWTLWTNPQMTSRGFRTWLNGIRGDIKNKKSRSFDTGLKAEITGFKKTLLKGKKFSDGKGKNVIAKITGTDPLLKNQYIVIGAHFDHLGVTNGQIYNGAEDNASGSAVVMEVARLMKEHNIQTKRTVIFCLWTAEELGLVGSRFWVKNPTDSVKMDQVVTYFNMDMVGLGDQINAPGALNFPSIWEVIKRDQDQEVFDVVKAKEGGPGGSDHSAFIELGIEALALMTGGSGGHPDYHDTGDDVKKLNSEILSKTGKFVLQGTINLANETETELLIADRQNIYDAMRWRVTVINPELDVEGSWSVLQFENNCALTDSMLQKIKKLKQPKDDANSSRRSWWRRYSRTAYSTGIKGAEIFDFDINFMKVAKEVLGFGRIDFCGDDSVWFNHGLTEQGAAAWAGMEKQVIVPHLKNPSKVTLEAVLEKAEKPFLISGFTDLDDSLIARINKKKVLISVDFDPKEIDACVEQLEALKTKFDDTDNLLLNVTNKDELDEAKKNLFKQLIKNGWKKKEIYAIGGAGTSRRSRGNLDQLPRERPQSSRGR